MEEEAGGDEVLDEVKDAADALIYGSGESERAADGM
jgi:hypothetical protein